MLKYSVVYIICVLFGEFVMQSKSASTKMKCPKQCKKGISSVNECTDCCIQLSASANLFYLFSNQNRSFNLFVFL